MAGGEGPHAVHQDPALLKWNNMVTNRYKHFRWTGRTARVTFVYAVVVPSMFLYLAAKTEGKYEFRGKLRGDTISER